MEPQRKGYRAPKIQLLLALLIATVGLIVYLSRRSRSPVTGEMQHVALSPEQEVALGLQATPQLTREFGGELGHPVVDGYVEAVGQRVVARSNAKQGPYEFDFHVLGDQKTVNAFALPGGQVFVTVALLKRLRSEAQLAGVLGHEMGHVIGRHGAEHLAKQQFARTLVVSVGVAATNPDRPGGSEAAAAVAAAIAELTNMKYGRDDELQSDQIGLRFMQAAGYDPKGLVELMRVLAQASKRRVPEFFSTHPNPENREARIEALAAQAAGGETGEGAYRTSVLDHLGEEPE